MNTHVGLQPNQAQSSAPTNLLTVGDVARILNVSPTWVRDHGTRRQPRLPALKMGKLLRFRPEDIAQFLEDVRTYSAW